MGRIYNISHILIHFPIKHPRHFQIHFPLDIFHLLYTLIALQFG